MLGNITLGVSRPSDHLAGTSAHTPQGPRSRILSWAQSFDPLQEFYEGNRPGATLLGTSSRRDETILARLRSGHTRAQWYVAGLKFYPPCPNCNVTQATSAHILACIGCHKNQVLLQIIV
ncbi:hypothetical protein TNCV_1602831 [Trichonephila clavipes]|nr:hypothetical protein TNCV_1602831 [Trichonephila clavipes]